MWSTATRLASVASGARTTLRRSRYTATGRTSTTGPPSRQSLGSITPYTATPSPAATSWFTPKRRPSRGGPPSLPAQSCDPPRPQSIHGRIAAASARCATCSKTVLIFTVVAADDALKLAVATDCLQIAAAAPSCQTPHTPDIDPRPSHSRPRPTMLLPPTVLPDPSFTSGRNPRPIRIFHHHEHRCQMLLFKFFFFF